MRFLAASSNWLLVLLTVTFACLQRNASAQPGFLSLDCGAPAPYTDQKGISWVPDDAYISDGKTASVASLGGVDPFFYSFIKDLRYFPDSTRTRYCYSLPTIVGQNYLIRATFFHGGYDNSPVVKFDTAVDVFSTRKTFSFNVQKGYGFGEYIFQAFKDNVQYCLYRLSPTGNPFISSLELRPVDNSMYAAVAGGSALSHQARVSFGPLIANITRYPSDPYDRFWATPGVFNGASPVYSTSVVNTGFAVDKPPPAVMNTAITNTVTGPGIYYIYWLVTPTFANNVFIINVYFAELELANAQNRIFDILVNGLLWVPNLNIYSSAVNALYKPIEFTSNSSAVNGQGTLNVTLQQTGSKSGPPPLWNALEVLSVHERLPGTLASDVAAIEGLKIAFGLEAGWTGDPCLILPYDWLACSTDSPPRVTAVKLSSANLSGPIPDLRALTSLTTLDLDNNHLTGPIPAWLASMPNLQELHLQNNDLSGNVPKGLLGLGPGLNLEGNPGLCLNTTCPTGSKPKVMIIVGAVVGALVAVGIAIAVVVIVCCCCHRPPANMVNKVVSPPVSEIVMEEGATARGSRYTLAQVMNATKKNAILLGKGGFGPVYYGKLPTGQEVAVKVSEKGSNQGSKEFINEIELLTRVHHKNLVSLVGYCDEGDNLILLYEYMSKGTVQEHLYGMGEKKKESLDWKTRLQIALNSAQGLEYLHVGCQPVIFHRDVKSNNILLNDRMIAKVADFGLSKSAESKENVTHMSTMVKGTIGYLDPEYYMTNQLTDKSDVYAFGIFLLELICARPPFIQQLPEDQRRLDQWVRPYLERGTVEEIVDPDLAGQYDFDAMWKVVDLAMQSVEPKGKHRPNMSTVVQELRAVVAVENNESSSNPTHQPQDSSSAFRFDIPDSTTTSNAQFGADTSIHAR